MTTAPSVLFVCVENGGKSQMVAATDDVVTLGRGAHVGPVDGTRFENWDTDESSERGIDGITRRVLKLRAELLDT